MLRRNFTWAGIFSAAVLFILQFNACKKDEPTPGLDEPPTASFASSQDETEVTFTYDGVGAASYAWDFGDGNTSTEASPTHMYEDYGEYEVTLEVSNDEGSDDATETVSVDVNSLKRGPALGYADKDGVFTSTLHQRMYFKDGSTSLVKNASADAWCASSGTGYQNVGVVTVKQDNLSENLERGSNNRYSWSEEVASQTGYKKGYGPSWSMGGGGSHGSVNGLSNALPFPGVKSITSDRVIDGSGSYTLTHDGGINNTDSVIYSIMGDAGTVTKRFGSSTASATFSASDLQKVGTGMVTLQVAGYSIYQQTLGSNTYVVINQTLTEAAAKVE